VAEDGRPTTAESSIEVEVGPVAHGGACVARHDGRVVFVRHALPGERVLARITEDRHASYCRADAVQVLRASPDRVEPPCPHARPGRCGGCDWQHAAGAAQRRLKADVIGEQFSRIAGLDVTALLGEVAELPGGLLGWRSRITYAANGDGRLGLHRHRREEVELLERCPLGMPAVGDAPALSRSWPGYSGVEVSRGADGTAVLGHRRSPGRSGRGRRPPDTVHLLSGPPRLTYQLAGRTFAVSAGGFWQVHPAAAQAFADAVVAGTGPQAGETVLDLYAGAGALTAVLALAVGPAGRVVGVEASATATADAAANLADLPWVDLRTARVTPDVVAGLHPAPDVVVLDPPRAGAGAPVMTSILDSGPRVVGYLACDPASLARDVKVAVQAGWRLASLSAFDAFPMTHHVETFATLVPS
jgi:tRNA/tmRNA/rRNA uracil-C5-methylase (TrmA/RlmC/RlmD family)